MNYEKRSCKQQGLFFNLLPKQRMPADNNLLPASAETGALGIMHLKRYWARQIATLNMQLSSGAYPEEWPLDNYLFSTLGLGLEQTLRFIFTENPGFDHFEKWILELNNGYPDREKIDLFNSMVENNDGVIHTEIINGVLSPEELLQWQRDGYIIVRGAVSTEDCEATVQLISEFLQIDRNDSSTWYKDHERRKSIMVEFYQHPLLESNRQSPRIRSAFEQIWQQRNLQVVIDRTGFSPPSITDTVQPVSRLHWDVSLHPPIPFGTQGILYLTDTAENGGALRVVPGFHNTISAWLQQLPEGANPREQDLEKSGAKPIAAAAGDFIIWHHALPHAAGINKAATPRFVQYINYTPAITTVQSIWV